MDFQIWHYWVLAAFFFFVLEVFIPGFIVGSMGIGCLLAMVGALLNLPLWFNIVLFIVGFFIGITMLKPLLKRMEKTSDIKTNADRLIGSKGKVIENISPETGSGWVHVDGDNWKAISQNNSLIEKGKMVEIVALESIVVTVRPLVSNNNPSESKTEALASTIQNNKGIIISIGNRKEIIHHDEILCFYSQQKITYLVKTDHKQLVVDESLERLEERLGNHRFFRANRQFFIVADLVKEYRTLNDGKIELALKPLPNIPTSISVSRLKAHAFRKWMDKQLN